MSPRKRARSERDALNPETLAADEDHASAEARSALTSLLLTPKGGRTGAIEFHA
jgi:hypothetical protein